MLLLFIIIIIFYVWFLAKNNSSKEKSTINNEGYYKIKQNPMTKTEFEFFKILKEITNTYNFIILPQVNLQEIFETNSYKDFNKIKAKSIDFAIVDNKYNYKIFIELDDYTHKREKRIERDTFVNNLFQKYNLKLIRINVNDMYKEQTKKYINDVIKEVV